MNKICRALTIISITGMGLLGGCKGNDPTERLKSTYVETTDYAEAITYADALDKNILIGFTGSDWCENSKNMIRKLSRQRFKDSVAEDVIYLNLDFPEDPEKRHIVKRNQTYAARYGIMEMPTFLIVNKDGEELGRIVGDINTERLAVMASDMNIRSAVSEQGLAEGRVVGTIEEAINIAGDKKILVEFTGSDWCPPCKMMKKEVFETKKFKDYVKEQLVHVYLDFPRRTKLAPEVAEYNSKAGDTYDIKAFPTYVILNGEGKELARSRGFMVGGPDRFIEWTNRQ